MCLCDHWIYKKDAIINIFGNMILKYSIQYNYVAISQKQMELLACIPQSIFNQGNLVYLLYI